MLLNADTVLVWPSRGISLYPYLKDHVVQYHAWMSDAELRLLTASEELTLEEEYEMQAAWREDNDSKYPIHKNLLIQFSNHEKELTFIITRESATKPSGNINTALTHMIGDINLFLSEIDTEEEDTESGFNETSIGVEAQDQAKRYTGELELMIAEPSARGKGYGKLALLLFISYVLRHARSILPTGELVRFSVKIGEDNSPSLGLFESIGFKRIKFASYFREWEMHMFIDTGTETNIEALMQQDHDEVNERKLF